MGALSSPQAVQSAMDIIAAALRADFPDVTEVRLAWSVPGGDSYLIRREL